MFDARRRHGPEILRDLAWRAPERWHYYEARYGVDLELLQREAGSEATSRAS